MSESQNQTDAYRRNPTAFQNWRFSETILLLGIFLTGVLILCIHLATWGRAARHDAKRLKPGVCAVVDRAVQSRRDDEGQLRYRPEIKIHYKRYDETFDVWTYERATLTDDQGFYFDRETAERILTQYEPGKFYRCWISDDDPTQVTLVKASHVWGWVFLIIPTALILFGGVWSCVRVRERMRSKEAAAILRKQESEYPNVPTFEGERGVKLSKRLKADVKSSFAFYAAIFGTCAWNLASWGVLAYFLISSNSRSEYVYSALVGALFCAIGLLFICRLWGLYRIERVVGSTALEISTIPIEPRRKAKLCLILTGRIEAKRLDVFVKCEEIARYVQGTNSICHRHEVYSKTIFTKYAVDVPAKSEERLDFSLMLPLGVAHSFVAEHNEINWKLVVRMEFADGGAYERAFDAIVKPTIAMDS